MLINSFIFVMFSMLYSYRWKLNAVCTAGRRVQMQRVLNQLPLSSLTFCINLFWLVLMILRQPVEICEAEVVGKIKEKTLNLVFRIWVNSKWSGIWECYARCLCYNIEEPETSISKVVILFHSLLVLNYPHLEMNVWNLIVKNRNGNDLFFSPLCFVSGF